MDIKAVFIFVRINSLKRARSLLSTLKKKRGKNRSSIERE